MPVAALEPMSVEQERLTSGPPRTGTTVVALVESLDHVCYRYRLQVFTPWLHARGISFRPVVLGKGLRRLFRILKLGQFSVVVLQRRLLPVVELMLLRKVSRWLIYDVDDALFYRDSFHPKGLQSNQRLFRYWLTVNLADRVFAGNRFLREYTACLTNERKIRLVPTCIDPTRYPIAVQENGRPLKLVWIGSKSTLGYLEQIRPHLLRAAHEVQLQLHVIADAFPQWQQLPILKHPWSEATEAQLLSSCHVGISWLTDDGWCKGKCGLKVLQYMAAGLPVVANPVGIHAELISHGERGLLASGAEQWTKLLAKLADQPALRAAMGLQARRFVERHYSVQRWGPLFADYVLEEIPATQALLATAPTDRDSKVTDGNVGKDCAVD